MPLIYTYNGETDYEDGATTGGWQVHNFSYGGRITFVEAGEIDQLGMWSWTASGTIDLRQGLWDTSGNLVAAGSNVSVSSGTHQWNDTAVFTAVAVAAQDYIILGSFAASGGRYGWDDANDGSFSDASYAGFPDDPAENLVVEGDSAKGYGGRANFTAGGTLFFQSNAGVVTPAGVVIKEPLKNVAGILAPTSGLTKETLKVATGSLTPVGTVVKKTLKLLTGILTPSGVAAGVRIIVKTITGALTPTGALTKKTVKLNAGSLAPVGTITKKVLKAFVGSLTPAGIVVKRTLKSIAGSLTPTSILGAIKQVGGPILKSISGSLTPTGTLIKETLKRNAGSLTPTSELVKANRKTLQGTLTPTGALTKKTLTSMLGMLTPSGAVAAATIFTQALAGALAPIGNLLTTFIPPSIGDRVYRRLLSVINKIRNKKRGDVE